VKIKSLFRDRERPHYRLNAIKHLRTLKNSGRYRTLRDGDKFTITGQVIFTEIFLPIPPRLGIKRDHGKNMAHIVLVRLTMYFSKFSVKTF
jgi:hypothetical protein